MSTDQSQARALIAVATAPPQKSNGTTWALWFFLAGFGGPWWYLGRPGNAILATIAYIFCGALILVGVGLFLVPVLWIVDAFAVRSSLRKYNGDRERYCQMLWNEPDQAALFRSS
jgi:hypothetical protein